MEEPQEMHLGFLKFVGVEDHARISRSPIVTIQLIEEKIEGEYACI